MSKIYITPFLLVFQCVLWSCTETNDVINPGDKPIIEAYLAPNHQVSLKVFTEIPYSESAEGISEPIDGLSIKITGTDGKVFNLTSVGNGLYESSKTQLIGSAKTIYTMEFDYKGRKVTALTEIPEKPVSFKIDKTSISRTQVDLSTGFPTGGGGFGGGGGGGPFGGDENTSVVLTWSNPNQSYHFVAVENTETTPVQIVIPPSGATLPSFRFFNEPLTGINNTLRSQSFQYFGNHNIVLYRVNAEYAALYQSSGTTSQNLSTPPTSIVNGLGIFTGINADTLKFAVNKN